MWSVKYIYPLLLNAELSRLSRIPFHGRQCITYLRSFSIYRSSIESYPIRHVFLPRTTQLPVSAKEPLFSLFLHRVEKDWGCWILFVYTYLLLHPPPFFLVSFLRRMRHKMIWGAPCFLRMIRSLYYSRSFFIYLRLQSQKGRRRKKAKSYIAKTSWVFDKTFENRELLRSLARKYEKPKSLLLII